MAGENGQMIADTCEIWAPTSEIRHFMGRNEQNLCKKQPKQAYLGQFRHFLGQIKAISGKIYEKSLILVSKIEKVWADLQNLWATFDFCELFFSFNSS